MEIVKIEIDGKEYSGTYSVINGTVYIDYGVAGRRNGHATGDGKGTAEMLLRELIREEYLP